ncbi:MAG: DUF1847 domain-containing protein [Coriobacteriales bacterium]|jgi:uncharacterized metal-binding protein
METNLTCADCSALACKRVDDEGYPAFCPTRGFCLADDAELQEELADEETWKVFEASAVSAYEAYDLKLSRIEEIILFAREMGARKIGIASCTTMAREAHAAVRIFREAGFEVVGAMCKIGSLTNEDLSLTVPRRLDRKTVICNPIHQARVLNEAGTDLNVVMGLCAGHDSLFFKHADALSTMLVVKDFKHDHCPVLALR